MIETFDSEYLIFTRLVTRPERKTCSWDVSSKSSALLGYIAWHAPWRQYVFYPTRGTLFNRACLRDIARFCEEMHKVRA